MPRRPAAIRLPRVSLAYGLRTCLRKGYTRRDFRSDVIAGVVIGMVALPLSMALAIASGAPPQHGLYTAIVAGVVVALLGGARFQVSGPTAAFVALLVPVVHTYGLGGLFVAGFMAGVIQVAMGILRLGRLINFVPHPVTTGFTAGIAVVIASIQISGLLGLDVTSAPAEFFGRLEAYWDARDSAAWGEAAIAVLTMAILIVVPRRSKIPGPFLALCIATLVAAMLAHWGGVDVATIATEFKSVVNGEVVWGIPSVPPAPAWPWSYGGPDGTSLVFNFALVRELTPVAFAIAMLGAIESLLSAVIADGTTGDRHDPDAELVALGIGNMLCPIFGGVPATAALARTATNIRAGAESPISSVVHALFVFTCIVAFAPIVGYLPMSAMAGLLVIVAYNMAEAPHFLRLVRTAPRSDVFVLLTCFGLTIMFDMVVAVGVGVVLGAMIFMRRMAELTSLELDGTVAREMQIPDDVVLYRIAGPLFFGAAERAFRSFDPPTKAKAIVLEMSAVPDIDATGLIALESVLSVLHKSSRKVVFSGLAPAPRATLERAGIVSEDGRVAFAATLEDAVAMATRHLARAQPLVATPTSAST